MAHLFILDVYVRPNRKYVNLSLIYYVLDFSLFMSQDDAYFHIHQNDPPIDNYRGQIVESPLKKLLKEEGNCMMVMLNLMMPDHFPVESLLPQAPSL